MPKYSNDPATVYAIRSKTTGKVYIGSTTRLEGRIKDHFRQLKQGLKLKTVFTPQGEDNRREKTDWQNDYDNYGRGDFEVYRIEDGLTLEERFEREDYWVKMYKADDPRFGYNMCPAKRRGETSEVEIVNKLPPLPQT